MKKGNVKMVFGMDRHEITLVSLGRVSFALAERLGRTSSLVQDSGARPHTKRCQIECTFLAQK